MLKYTKDDLGCYADGSLGHTHIREVLAEMVEDYYPSLAQELRATPSDDFEEEDTAIELLNDKAVANEYILFAMVDGDLVLIEEKELEA